MDTWAQFLHDSAAMDHGVHVYADVSELADSVATYLATGFDRGEPAVVVATPSHWDAFAAELAARGWPVEKLERHGLLFRRDAETMLAAISVDGRPSEERFEQVAGALIDRVSERFPGRRPRVFGEMVDMLCERGRPDAAAELEEIWNRFGQRRRFSLLCGYCEQGLGHDVLADVRRSHSHVLQTLHA